MRCCMDLLDRAGFKPVAKQEVLKPQRTLAEVDAELNAIIKNIWVKNEH
jgi:hypothetical protein